MRQIKVERETRTVPARGIPSLQKREINTAGRYTGRIKLTIVSEDDHRAQTYYLEADEARILYSQLRDKLK